MVVIRVQGALTMSHVCSGRSSDDTILSSHIPSVKLNDTRQQPVRYAHTSSSTPRGNSSMTGTAGSMRTSTCGMCSNEI